MQKKLWTIKYLQALMQRGLCMQQRLCILLHVLILREQG